MSAEDFDAYFDRFTRTAVRLETLPAFDVGGDEAKRIQAWREGLPRPERSVVTDEWLARIATTTIVDGKLWKRVRVVDDPLTDYQRQQMESYIEGQAIGERIVIAHRRDVPDHGGDVWLFDEGTKDSAAAVMNYDREGHWLGFELVTDPARLAEIAARIHRVEQHAAPLNVFLASVASRA